MLGKLDKVLGGAGRLSAMDPVGVVIQLKPANSGRGGGLLYISYI